MRVGSLWLCFAVSLLMGLSATPIFYSSAAAQTQQQRRAAGLELLRQPGKPTMYDLFSKVGGFSGPNPFTRHIKTEGAFDNRVELRSSIFKLVSLVRKHYPVHHVATLGRDAVYIADIFEALEMLMTTGPGVTRLGASSGSITGVEEDFLRHNGLLSEYGDPIKPFVVIDPTRWQTSSQLRMLITAAYNHYARQGRVQGLSQWVAGISTEGLGNAGSYVYDDGTKTPQQIAALLANAGVYPSSYVLNLEVSDLTYTANHFSWHSSFGKYSHGKNGQFYNPPPGVAGGSDARESTLWTMYEIGSVVFEPSFLQTLLQVGRATYGWDPVGFGERLNPEESEKLINEVGLADGFQTLKKKIVFIGDEDFDTILHQGIQWLKSNRDKDKEQQALRWLIGDERAWKRCQEIPDTPALVSVILRSSDFFAGMDPQQPADQTILSRYFTTPWLAESEALKTWALLFKNLKMTGRLANLTSGAVMTLALFESRPVSDGFYENVMTRFDKMLIDWKYSSAQRLRAWMDLMVGSAKVSFHGALVTAISKALPGKIQETVKAGFRSGDEGDSDLVTTVEVVNATMDSSAPLFPWIKDELAQQVGQRVAAHKNDIGPYLERFWYFDKLGFNATAESLFIQNLPSGVDNLLGYYRSIHESHRTVTVESAVRARLFREITSVDDLFKAELFFKDRTSDQSRPEVHDIIARLAQTAMKGEDRLQFVIQKLRSYGPVRNGTQYDLLFLLHVLFDQGPYTDPDQVRILLKTLRDQQVEWASYVLKSPAKVVEVRKIVQELRGQNASFESVVEMLELVDQIYSRNQVPPSHDLAIRKYFTNPESEAVENLKLLTNLAVTTATRFDQILRLSQNAATREQVVKEALFYPALHFAKDLREALQLMPYLHRDLELPYFVAAYEAFPNQGDELVNILLEQKSESRINPKEVLEQLSPQMVFQGAWHTDRIVTLLNLAGVTSPVGLAYAREALRVVDLYAAPQIFATNRFLYNLSLAKEWKEFRSRAYQAERDELGWFSATSRQWRRGFGWTGPVGKNSASSDNKNCQETLMKEKQ